MLTDGSWQVGNELVVRLRCSPQPSHAFLSNAVGALRPRPRSRHTTNPRFDSILRTSHSLPAVANAAHGPVGTGPVSVINGRGHSLTAKRCRPSVDHHKRRRARSDSDTGIERSQRLGSGTTCCVSKGPSPSPSLSTLGPPRKALMLLRWVPYPDTGRKYVGADLLRFGAVPTSTIATRPPICGPEMRRVPDPRPAAPEAARCLEAILPGGERGARYMATTTHPVDEPSKPSGNVQECKRNTCTHINPMYAIPVLSLCV